jgi:hypothetical protein
LEVYFTDKITQARDIYHIFKEEKGVEGGEGESFWIDYPMGGEILETLCVNLRVICRTFSKLYFLENSWCIVEENLISE